MNDFATKNYNDFPVLPPLSKNTFMRKVKYVAFAVLCMATFSGIITTTAMVGHSLQMERIAQHVK